MEAKLVVMRFDCRFLSRELSYAHNHTEEGESHGNVTVVSQLQNSMTTVLWLRQLVAQLSPLSPGFDPRPNNVG